MAVVATTYWDELAWDAEAQLPLVPLPAVSRVTDPGVLGYMATKDWHYVSSASLRPAALILQQIRLEARRRGWEKIMHGDAAPEAGGLGEGTHLRVKPPHTNITVQVSEIAGTGSERQTYPTRRDPKTPAWIRSRQNTFVPTGRLEIRWDRTTADEAGLPRMFRRAEVESRFALERQSENERLSNLVQDHMPEIRNLVGRSIIGRRHLDEFENRLVAWKQVTDRREFLTRLQEAGTGLVGVEMEAPASWMSSVERHVASLEAEVLAPAPSPDASIDEVYAYIGLSS